MNPVPLVIKMREKHRSQGGYCVSCRPQSRFPCEVSRLVIEHETLSAMVNTARKILQEIGTMSISRLDKRGEKPVQ